MTHVVIVGPMAAGKTTLGRALAAAWSIPFADSDADVEAATGATGRALAARDGVDVLHAHEKAVLFERLADEAPTVVAAAASVIDDDEVVARLGADDVAVIWLDAPAPTLAARGDGQDHRRETGLGEREELERRRRPRYATVATVRLDATTPPDRLVAAARRALGDR